MSLCRFKDIFGAPGQGVHAWRIPFANLALVDTALTLGAAWLLAKWTGSVLGNFLILFSISILFHWLFCVDTQLMQYLGLASISRPALN